MRPGKRTSYTHCLIKESHMIRPKTRTPRTHKKEAFGPEVIAEYMGVDPMAAAAGLGVAKAHLMGAYGHHIPGVVGRTLQNVGQGTVHSGLQHGLRGEKPLHGLTRFGMALFDPSMKHGYDSSYQLGAGLRKKFPGMDPEQILQHGGSTLAHIIPEVKGSAVERVLGQNRTNNIARALTTHMTPREALQGAGNLASTGIRSAGQAVSGGFRNMGSALSQGAQRLLGGQAAPAASVMPTKIGSISPALISSARRAVEQLGGND
jgi:hypothetical protein